MSTLVLLASIVGGFAGLLGIPTLFLLIVSARREAQRLREQPLRDDLAAMTKERDYYRAKCDNLETREPGRQGRS